MDSRRLIIQTPRRGIDQLKISVGDFWCHFAEPGKFTETRTEKILENYIDTASSVLDITKPEKINRIGWRSFLVYEFNHKVEDLNGIVKLRNGKTLATVVELSLANEVKMNIQLKLLEKRDGSGDSALLFDIDAFREDEITVRQARDKLTLVRKSFFPEKS